MIAYAHDYVKIVQCLTTCTSFFHGTMGKDFMLRERRNCNFLLTTYRMEYQIFILLNEKLILKQ